MTPKQLLDKVHAAIPFGIYGDLRDDVCQEAILAIMSGKFGIDELPALIKIAIKAQNNFEPFRFEGISSRARHNLGLSGDEEEEESLEKFSIENSSTETDIFSQYESSSFDARLRVSRRGILALREERQKLHDFSFKESKVSKQKRKRENRFFRNLNDEALRKIMLRSIDLSPLSKFRGSGTNHRNNIYRRSLWYFVNAMRIADARSLAEGARLFEYKETGHFCGLHAKKTSVLQLRSFFSRILLAEFGPPEILEYAERVCTWKLHLTRLI